MTLAACGWQLRRLCQQRRMASWTPLDFSTATRGGKIADDNIGGELYGSPLWLPLLLAATDFASTRSPAWMLQIGTVGSGGEWQAAAAVTSAQSGRIGRVERATFGTWFGSLVGPLVGRAGSRSETAEATPSKRLPSSTPLASRRRQHVARRAWPALAQLRSRSSPIRISRGRRSTKPRSPTWRTAFAPTASCSRWWSAASATATN